MSLEAWNERYRAGEQLFDQPSPLLERFAGRLAPGDALDLACGPGRNAIYVASLGWRVTAVDGSPIAVEILRTRARERHAEIETRVADLERNEFAISPGSYDLICACHYLQRDLLDPIKCGLRPGGLAILIVHLAGADEPQGAAHRAIPGELSRYFEGWRILHSYEGNPEDSGHSRAVAELVARKPV